MWKPATPQVASKFTKITHPHFGAYPLARLQVLTPASVRVVAVDLGVEAFLILHLIIIVPLLWPKSDQDLVAANDDTPQLQHLSDLPRPELVHFLQADNLHAMGDEEVEVLLELRGESGVLLLRSAGRFTRDPNV